MLRFDNIVFGPIHSRRLGRSLGINLLPRDGKICNFDCIYCECGWNAEGRTATALPSCEEISQALENKMLDMKEKGEDLDSITFSGHGEPTLHPEFPAIIAKTVELRDLHFPGRRISVLSNASMLDHDEIVEALKKVDCAILKLDAPNDAQARYINRPNAGYSVEKVIEGMKKFDGHFILQTMMLGSQGLDYRKDPAALQSWKDIVRELRPSEVMVYSLDRPSPQSDLEKIPACELELLLKDLTDEGINLKIY